jgi:hypothetical protein
MRADTPDLVSQFDDPQNYIAVALAEPDELLALLVGLVLEAHAAERERPGDSLERGLADRDADHAVKPASLAPWTGRAGRPVQTALDRGLT